MNTTFKKIAAFLSASAVVMTLSGCSDNGYIMTVDGMPIRTGVYISFQQTSMNNANDRLEELNNSDSDDPDNSDSSDSSESSENSENSSSGSEETSIFDQTVDGKTFSDWVKDDTLKGVKRFVGVQRQCEQFGITLTDDEKSQVNKEVQENWDTTSMNYGGYTFTVEQIYGFKTMGEYYTSQGIGIDSLKEIAMANKLNDKLFLHYYSEGGEKAVPDDELNKFIEENNAAYKLITLGYTDFRGDPLVTDEEKQEVVDRAKGYAERYNKGEKFVDILYDHDLLTAQNKARKEAEELYEETPQEGCTLEEYMDKKAKEATAEKGTSDDLYDEIIGKENSILSEELTEFIMNAPVDKKAAVYEGVTGVYLIIRSPMSDFPKWKEQNVESVLEELRGEEYDSMMDLMSQNYDVVQKDNLVNGKYSPEKLNK